MKRITAQPELNIIGKNIKLARENANLSQQELADKLELIAVYICRGSISRLESGQRSVTDIEIRALAKILKVSPNELFNWDEE